MSCFLQDHLRWQDQTQYWRKNLLPISCEIFCILIGSYFDRVVCTSRPQPNTEEKSLQYLLYYFCILITCFFRTIRTSRPQYNMEEKTCNISVFLMSCFFTGSFAPAGPNTIWKKRITKDNTETKAYEALMADEAHSIVPIFYREVEYNGDCILSLFDGFLPKLFVFLWVIKDSSTNIKRLPWSRWACWKSVALNSNNPSDYLVGFYQRMLVRSVSSCLPPPAKILLPISSERLLNNIDLFF